jgi:hypothetical protein
MRPSRLNILANQGKEGVAAAIAGSCIDTPFLCEVLCTPSSTTTGPQS